jgi:hypothetical protein
MRTMLREREPLAQLAAVFAVMCAAYADARYRAAAKRRTHSADAAVAVAAAAAVNAAADSPPLLQGSPAVSPSQMYALVFAPVVGRCKLSSVDP